MSFNNGPSGPFLSSLTCLIIHPMMSPMKMTRSIKKSYLILLKRLILLMPLFYQLPVLANQSWQAISNSQGLNTHAPLLLLDKNDHDLPRKFRSMKELVGESRSDQLLRSVPMSGSAQFSINQLPNMKKHMGQNVMIIDLRRESKAFLNQMPVTWYGKQNAGNLNLNSEEVLSKEAQLIQHLRQQKKVKLYRIDNPASDTQQGIIFHAEVTSIPVHQVATEKQLIETSHLGYKRFFVSDHRAPTDQTVDEFIQFTQSLKPSTWLHFHCRGGRGRTSTFMLMYAIMRIDEKVTLDELNNSLSKDSMNLLVSSHTQRDLWKDKYTQERIQFIQLFYDYIHDPTGFQAGVTWSDYRSQR
jgi:protein tyrosine phosphatase